MIVLQTEAGTPIQWRCSACADEGIISNWEGSPFDLRRQRLTLAGAVTEIVIPDDVAAALRELLLLDADCERLSSGSPGTTAGPCWQPATKTSTR